MIVFVTLLLSSFCDYPCSQASLLQKIHTRPSRAKFNLGPLGPRLKFHFENMHSPESTVIST